MWKKIQLAHTVSDIIVCSRVTWTVWQQDDAMVAQERLHVAAS